MTTYFTGDMAYIAVRLNGRRTVHHSRAALLAAMRRARGANVVVDYWRSDAPPPNSGASAREWEAYRARRGYAGER